MKPWPPGKLHSDLQGSRTEVFRLGSWSIFNKSPHQVITNANWQSFIMHCDSWEEWEAVPETVYANTVVKGEMVEYESKQYKQRLVQRHCNANMDAFRNKFCPDCRRRIPNEIVALWTLQNFDQIQEANSI
jgi:hypothetical protein